MDEIRLLDKNFREFIGEQEIRDRVKVLAEEINHDLEGMDVIFLGILNGSIMFAADLYRHITLPSQLSFLKIASYSGVSSTGRLRDLIGLDENITGKTVVVIEDIVDTGNTLAGIIDDLSGRGAGMIKVATLLLKPEVFSGKLKPHYVGFEIPNNFVVGYGLDYDGFGRNLPSIYRITN